MRSNGPCHLPKLVAISKFSLDLPLDLFHELPAQGTPPESFDRVSVRIFLLLTELSGALVDHPFPDLCGSFPTTPRLALPSEVLGFL